MTEENSNTLESTAESAQATPGQQLRQGREAAGLSQQQVADRLHLRLANIQDIETDKHQPGVSITFTKGYVRIYAKLLGMPVEPLLEAFDILHQGEKQPAKLQSFSQRVAKQAHDDRWMMVTYFIVFLVVASLVIWWYQQSDTSIMKRLNLFSDTTSESAVDDITEGESVSAMQNKISLPVEIAISEEDAKQQEIASGTNEVPIIKALGDTSSSINESSNNASSTKSNEVLDSQTEGPTQLKVLGEDGEQSTEQEPQTFSDTAEASDASPSLGTGRREIINGYVVNPDGTVDLVFTFKEDCWLSVTDVNDEVIALGVKVKGRVMSINGVPPISINMCPPEHVEIDFAGSPVNLSAYSRGFPIQFTLTVAED